MSQPAICGVEDPRMLHERPDANIRHCECPCSPEGLQGNHDCDRCRGASALGCWYGVTWDQPKQCERDEGCKGPHSWEVPR
jgi:hypothetical protein